jgi:hypothetical protein
MEVNTTPAVMKRNLKKVNWASVVHDLRRSTPKEKKYTWTRATLDSACDNLYDSLRASLDKHAPKRPPARQFTHWWNNDCADKKKNCIRTEKFARCHPTSIAKRERKTKRDEYKNQIYAAKKNSWRKFIKD